MATPLVPVKTPHGQAELSGRKRSVSQRHRTVLVLVDGKRAVEEVLALARSAGASDTCFDDLLAGGMIALPQATTPAPLVMESVAPESATESSAASVVAPEPDILPMALQGAVPAPEAFAAAVRPTEAEAEAETETETGFALAAGLAVTPESELEFAAAHRPEPVPGVELEPEVNDDPVPAFEAADPTPVAAAAALQVPVLPPSATTAVDGRSSQRAVPLRPEPESELEPEPVLAAAAVFVAATPSLPPLPDEGGDDADHASPEAAAWLPASRTVFPESVLSDSMLAGLASPESAWQVDAASGSDADLPMEEARELMLSAVRSHAPVAGSLTLMKIRRARSRYELERLLEEVESRIEKSRKREPSDQTVRRVRDLLGHSRPA